METVKKSFSIDSSKLLGEALTYDDVLLVPAYSEVLPREVSISTQLTRNIRINAPLVAAAMDTVSERDLAIAIARQGGVAIIHKNMSIEAQSDQVRSVKRSESGMILDPVTLTPDAQVADAHALMKKFSIGGIPIVDTEGGRLVGILTNRDLRFERDFSRKVSELMTKENLVVTAKGTTFDEARDILQRNKIEKLPVVDEVGRLIGLITYKDLTKHKNYPSACKDSFGRLVVGAAVGVARDTLERVSALVKAGVDLICVDTAHGHSKSVIDMVRSIKTLYPSLEVVGGNIATGEAALALAAAGADAVKVGVGPGSICTTRIVAGVGVPQLSAIYDVAQALKGTSIPIIADGGVRYTGDIAKAIVAGASTVMAGSLFAGTEEAPGETIIFDGRKFKVYRGMGSLGAMELGSKDRYFQDIEGDVKKLVPEGIEGRVPFKGSLAEVMVQYTGGLRASMGYCGCGSIEEMQKQGRFVRITSSGILESHPHNITITKESPNYSRR